MGQLIHPYAEIDRMVQEMLARLKALSKHAEQAGKKGNEGENFTWEEMRVRFSGSWFFLRMDGASISVDEENIPRNWLNEFHARLGELIDRKQSNGYFEYLREQAEKEKFSIGWQDTTECNTTVIEVAYARAGREDSADTDTDAETLSDAGEDLGSDSQEEDEFTGANFSLPAPTSTSEASPS